MKHLFSRLLLCAAALLALQTASAQSLYQSFGEKPGLVRLIDDFYQRLQQDARTQPHFEKTNQAHVKAQLVEQLCQLSGGPCVYKGVDMKNAHVNLDITKSDFNALVEILQQSMSTQNIAFSAQNRMLALLAPMHKDVITVK
jgi:hemoglobin